MATKNTQGNISKEQAEKQKKLAEQMVKTSKQVAKASVQITSNSNANAVKKTLVGLLPLDYIKLQFVPLKTLDYFKKNLKDILILKRLKKALATVSNVANENDIRVSVAVGSVDNIFKLDLYAVVPPATVKQPVGWFIYIPKQSRLDVWDGWATTLPLFQAIKKRIVYKHYSPFMDRMRIELMFKRFLEIL